MDVQSSEDSCTEATPLFCLTPGQYSAVYPIPIPLLSWFRTMYDFPHSQANSSSIIHAQNWISEQYLGKNMYLKCVGLSKPCISICICILSRYIGQKSICIVSRYLIWQSMCILSRYRKKVSLPTTVFDCMNYSLHHKYDLKINKNSTYVSLPA